MVKKGRLFPLILILVLSLLASSLPQVGRAGEANLLQEASFEPDQILVRFQPWVGEKEKARATRLRGGRVLEQMEETGFSVVGVSLQTDPLAAVLRLNQDPRVEQAELNYRREVLQAPNDPHYPSQWALLRIEAEQGWEATTGSEVVVAIVDTGVDLDHPDLAGRIVAGYNFIDNNDIPRDDNGHGTHVAGIAAAAGNNGLGVAGVSWSGKIMPIKVLDAGGVGNDYQVAQGIIWAVDHGAKIINLSFGGTQYSSLLQEAINYAHEKGAVVVAAAGNEALNGNPPFYPAALDHVIAVGALDANDARASFSGFGQYLDVSAPGVAILSTALDDDYAVMSGTSMAASFISGQASLILSRSPGESADRLEEIIKQTAYDLGESGRDDVFGYGKISLARSLATVQPASPQGEGVIQGRIITVEGRPAAGARAETGGKATLSDANGSFSLSGLSPGIYDLTYSAAGFGRQKQEAVPVGEGATTVPMVVLSPAQGEIRGRVTSYRGKAIRGAAVRIDQTVVPTDGRGRFRFTCLEEGFYTIYYDAPGYRGQKQENISVTGGITITPTVVLSR